MKLGLGLLLFLLGLLLLLLLLLLLFLPPLHRRRLPLDLVLCRSSGVAVLLVLQVSEEPLGQLARQPLELGRRLQDKGVQDPLVVQHLSPAPPILLSAFFSGELGNVGFFIMHKKAN